MLSIVERDSTERPIDRVVCIDEAQAPAEVPSENPEEFEIVLGRRQVASVLFVSTVILVAFSAISYLAGKSFAPKAPVPESAPAPAPVAAAPAPVVVPQPAPQPEPAVKPERARASEAAPASDPAPERPLFADPKPGQLYLQLGAVEKGIAIIMADGLRKHGFDAFVGPGPNDHIFRVLVGPLDGDGYKKAKGEVDALGLSTFARRYQQ